MTIAEQIQQDMVTAMRTRETTLLGTLRMVKAALQMKALDKRAPLEDQETIAVLNTLIKQRRDSVEAFTRGNRPELAEKEAAEIVMIEAYMPKAAGEEEITRVVRESIAEMGSPALQDMGAVMKTVMAKFAAAKTRVEGRMVSETVKRELAPK